MKQRGFSLIEVVVTMAIFALATMALSLTTLSAHQKTEWLKERDVRHSTATAILERVLTLPFGSSVDGAPTTRQLDLVFGSDETLHREEAPSLVQLSRVSPLWFKVESTEARGKWTIVIDNDLDGNGVVEEEVDGIPTLEGQESLYRIEILYEDQVVLRTIRTQSPNESAEG